MFNSNWSQCSKKKMMYFLNNGDGQLEWSLLLLIVITVSINVTGLSLPTRPVGQQQITPSSPNTDVNMQFLTSVVNAIKNAQEIGRRLYKRWRILDCPNLEVAVYGDCFVKSEITLIAAAAAGSSVLIVLICCLCRRRKRLEEQAYRSYPADGSGGGGGSGIGSINGQFWESGHKGEPTRPENWNWFKERQERKQREREERWAREREREIERRRKREKKKREKWVVGGGSW